MLWKPVLMDSNEGLYIDFSDLDARIKALEDKGGGKPIPIEPEETTTQYAIYTSGPIAYGATGNFKAWELVYYTEEEYDDTINVDITVNHPIFYSGLDGIEYQVDIWSKEKKKKDYVDEYYYAVTAETETVNIGEYYGTYGTFDGDWELTSLSRTKPDYVSHQEARTTAVKRKKVTRHHTGKFIYTVQEPNGDTSYIRDLFLTTMTDIDGNTISLVGASNAWTDYYTLSGNLTGVNLITYSYGTSSEKTLSLAKLNLGVLSHYTSSYSSYVHYFYDFVTSDVILPDDEFSSVSYSTEKYVISPTSNSNIGSYPNVLLYPSANGELLAKYADGYYKAELTDTIEFKRLYEMTSSTTKVLYGSLASHNITIDYNGNKLNEYSEDNLIATINNKKYAYAPGSSSDYKIWTTTTEKQDGITAYTISEGTLFNNLTVHDYDSLDEGCLPIYTKDANGFNMWCRYTKNTIAKRIYHMFYPVDSFWMYDKNNDSYGWMFYIPTPNKITYHKQNLTNINFQAGIAVEDNADGFYGVIRRPDKDTTGQLTGFVVESGTPSIVANTNTFTYYKDEADLTTVYNYAVKNERKL